MIFHYESLMADFNSKLVTHLRGHSADNEYLETWVPDEDPVASVLNMVESALSAGLDEMQIRFAATTMNAAQRANLLAAVAKIATARFDEFENSCELVVNGAKS